MKGYAVTTPSTSQLTLLSVEDMKKHLEIKPTQSRWDGMIEAFIKASVAMGERLMNRQILSATITFTFNKIQRFVHLPGGKVTEFTTLKYYDTNNEQQTLVEDTDFVIDSIPVPAVLHILDNKEVETYNRSDAYEAVYSAGWAADDVPADILQAIKMTAAHFFENREEVLVSKHVEQLPFAAETIFKNYRIPNV
jgi:uncharacterized phiE125 gp8 family phage protein